MGIFRGLVAIGTGITTFLIVTVTVIELLAFEFSAIIGLPVGLLAGVAIAAVTVTQFAELRGLTRWVTVGVAGFGVGVLLTLGLSYVNIAEVSSNETVGAGLGIGGLAALAVMLLDLRAQNA